MVGGRPSWFAVLVQGRKACYPNPPTVLLFRDSVEPSLHRRFWGPAFCDRPGDHGLTDVRHDLLEGNSKLFAAVRLSTAWC